MKNNYYFSLIKSFKDGIKNEPMVSLGNSVELPALIRQIGARVILACSDGPVKITKRLTLLITFSKFLFKMSKHHGAGTTVKYLKASLLALQKAISKDRIQSLRDIEPDLPLPRLTTSRLPRIIPLADRRSIMSGNTFVIRYWSTLFSLYRVIRVPGKLKLGTIGEPYSGDEHMLSWGIEKIKAYAMIQSFRFDKTLLSKEFGLLPLETASPSNKVSWRGWFSDVEHIVRNKLDKPLLTLLGAIGQDRLKLNFMFISDLPKWAGRVASVDTKIDNYPTLGQLSTKEEAAGKIRVFAMVDVWTQSALKPLHEMLFKFLKSLPNDGTFNQGLSVQRCMEKAKVSGKSFGYDLSAATDRLPIKLQTSLLSSLIGEEASVAWAELLVGRQYRLYSKLDGNQVDELLTYKVGQPMGALSSWAMLAVTHHFIVQIAYQMARPLEWNLKGPKYWYSNYELLGDDIVLFDRDVSEVYLSLMTSFGVAINKSKSVVSNNNSFEFAKVFSSNGKHLSPVSWKMFISQNTLMGRVNILFQLLYKRNAHHPIPFVKNVVWRRLGDLGNYGLSLLALITMLLKERRCTYDVLLKVLILPVPNWSRKLSSSLKDLNIPYLEKLLTSLARGEEIPTLKDSKRLEIFKVDTPWHKIALFREITKVKTLLKSSDEVIKVSTEKILSDLYPTFPSKYKNMDLYQQESWTETDWGFFMIYEMVKKWVELIYKDISFIDRIDKFALNLSLDELISLLDRLNRVRELFELSLRAQEKINGKAKNRNVVDSPLKALQFLRKVNWKRPDWTKNTYF